MTKEQTKALPLTVLLAEDNEANLFFLRSIIEQHFKDVLILEAQNGLLAINQYKEHFPDLILMDLNMPVLRGDAAAMEIRKIGNERGHQVKIILLSGSSVSDDHTLLNDIPIDAYLLKPFQAETLKVLMNDQLSRPPELITYTHTDRTELANDLVGHFDFDQLLQSLASDYELVREVLQHALKYLEQFPAKFEQQLSTKSLAPIHQLAHELGGVAANIHLDALTKIAREIEQKEIFDSDFLQIRLGRIKLEITIVLPILNIYTQIDSK